MSEPAWEETAGLLGKDGVAIPCEALDRLTELGALIERFAAAMSLVSRGDRGVLWRRHFVDSLSLAPWIARWAEEGSLLDVGSGAGFPALVVKAVLPELPMMLVERSSRKAGFLRMAVGQLAYENVVVVCGELKDLDAEGLGGVVTARAIERPAAVADLLVELVRAGAVWLCQAGGDVVRGASGVGVESAEDEWKARGWRRGDLYIVQRETI